MILPILPCKSSVAIQPRTRLGPVTGTVRTGTVREMPLRPRDDTARPNPTTIR
jgi:hypothetical protein